LSWFIQITTSGGRVGDEEGFEKNQKRVRFGKLCSYGV